jgi:hypothetical protein
MPASEKKKKSKQISSCEEVGRPLATQENGWSRQTTENRAMIILSMFTVQGTVTAPQYIPSIHAKLICLLSKIFDIVVGRYTLIIFLSLRSFLALVFGQIFAFCLLNEKFEIKSFIKTRISQGDRRTTCN